MRIAQAGVGDHGEAEASAGTVLVDEGDPAKADDREAAAQKAQ